jgi:hypothetical protein
MLSFFYHLCNSITILINMLHHNIFLVERRDTFTFIQKCCVILKFCRLSAISGSVFWCMCCSTSQHTDACLVSYIYVNMPSFVLPVLQKAHTESLYIRIVKDDKSDAAYISLLFNGIRRFFSSRWQRDICYLQLLALDVNKSKGAMFK